MTSTSLAAPPSTAPRPVPVASTEMTHGQILRTMTGLLAALFTAMISSTIVAVALPTIIGALHGTQSQYTWVITASLLATTVSTPIWGKLSDLFSKKILVQLAIVTFVAGSVAAGFSPNVPFLLSMRVVQGLGMGGLTALTQAIMGAIIAPRERGRYSGYMGAVMAVSTVAGPLVGGFIVDSPLGWRFTFFLCVPLAIIALILIQLTLHLHTARRHPKIDYLGALLISAGASLPLIWVTFAGHDFAWLSWQSAAFLAPTAILIVLLIFVESRAAEPLVPFRLLANRTAILVILASVSVGIAMYGAATFLGQYFQIARDYTPTEAGLLTTPLMVSMLISSTVCGQIISRTGRWKWFIVGGAVLLTAGLIGLGLMDHQTSLVQLGVFQAMIGLGMGAMMQNLVLAVQNTVDVRDIGATSATISFFRSLGGTIGVSVLGAVLTTSVANRIADGLTALGIPAGQASSAGGSLDLTHLPAPIVQVIRAAYGDGTGVIFLVGAGAAVVSLVAAFLIKEIPLRTTVELRPASAAAQPATVSAVAAEPATVSAVAAEPATVSAVAAEPATVSAVAGAAPRIDVPGAEPDGFVPLVDEPTEPGAGHVETTIENGHTVRTVAPAPRERGALAPMPAPSELEEAQFDAADLDDPTQRVSSAALDVLVAAQDQARRHRESVVEGYAAIESHLDRAGREVDEAVARFHADLDTIKHRLRTLPDERPGTVSPDGTGGSTLRGYEYSLLLHAQQTADRVNTIARQEAERLLTDADAEVAQLEKRIEHLRRVETELAERVGGLLREPE